MWWVFPQMRGLGHSEKSIRYGIETLAEARDYLADDVLGPHLIECTEAALQHAGEGGRDRLREIFGEPDDTKFISSMTLFLHAAEPGTPMHALARTALDTFNHGDEDLITVRLTVYRP